MFKRFLQGKQTSLLVLFVLIAFIWVIRLLTPAAGTLSWDVFGYYLWLPAKFIQNDFWLDNIQWVNQILIGHKPSETLYQAFIGPGGTWMYRYFLGTGIMYLPFFFIGHLCAFLGGYPMDGFSLPYHYAVAYGGVVYASAGLYFLWKILKKFFTDRIVSWVLIALVAGTNYLYFTTIESAASVNYLFLLLAVLIWTTLRWHEKPRTYRAALIGAICGLILLIRPSEIFVVLIPLLWPVEGSWKTKILLVRKHWMQVIVLLIAGLIVIFPQLFYWKQETGSWIFDSYIDPGVGLDFDRPHFLEFLFSFRKGWLIYTPVMVFGLAGFIGLYRKRRDLFWPLGLYFLISFYIIASWSEWWYGGGYGQRPMIVSYVVLAITMGYSIEKILQWNYWRLLFGLIFLAFISLNLFQTWQYTHYILHPDRMSRPYYFKVFGSTTKNPEDEQYLLEKHAYGWNDEFKNPERYKMRNIGLYDFEGLVYPDFAKYYADDTAHTARFSFKMDSTLEFSPEIRTTFSGITDKDHAWIYASVWFYFPDSLIKDAPLLVVSTLHKGGNYKYRTFEVKDKTPGTWQKVECYYQTPEVRSIEDEVAVYIWNRSKTTFYIDDLRADAYTLKN